MTAVSSGLSIRPAVEADFGALHEICLKTADAGKDGSALFGDPLVPGYLWSVPYAKFEPDFAFVLSEGDRAIGYVIGTPDTAAFEKRLIEEWWPFVRTKVAGHTPVSPTEKMALFRIAEPEVADRALIADYPAHLHINILPGAQSSGWGRKLIETELDAMKRHGVSAVHLGVAPDNDRAKGFYRHVGFEDISTPDHCLFGMKLQD